MTNPSPIDPGATPRPDPEALLDYDQLMADYQAGLVNRLRGFGPAAEYLSLWVPDEAPLTSIRNMLDAAANVGQKTFRLKVGPATLGQFEPEALLAVARQFGDPKLDSCDQDGVVLEVKALRVARIAPEPVLNRARQTKSSVPPVPTPQPVRESAPLVLPSAVSDHYRANVESAAENPRHHQRRPETRPDEVLLESKVLEVVLWVTVDPLTHQIQRAGFSGAPNRVVLGLMEQLCRIITGAPLQDASDHATLRLEHELRVDPDDRPVPGIVTPEAADPAFRLPQALIRATMKQYRSATGYAETANTHDTRPGRPWMDADAKHRLRTVNACLAAVATQRGLPPGSLSAVDVQFDVRIVVRLPDDLVNDDKQPLVIGIERALRRHVDPRLEVYLEEIRDKNKLRRLAIVDAK